VLRIIQFFTIAGFACDETAEDGYAAGADVNARGCAPHHADYEPQDWTIGLGELLRQVQFYNAGGYHPCGATEDLFCPGAI